MESNMRKRKSYDEEILGRRRVFYDIETFLNYGLFTFYIEKDDEGVEIKEIEFVGDEKLDSEATIELREVIRKSVKDWMLIGYNNRNYDNIILLKLFDGMRSKPISPEEINSLSRQIIELQTLKWANIPEGFLSYDVYNFQNKMPSLKIVGTLFGGDIRETPIPFTYQGEFDDEMRAGVRKYCRHDVMITREVFNSELGQKYFKMEITMCKIAMEEIPVEERGCFWSMFSTSRNYFETILKAKTKFTYKAQRETMSDEFGIYEIPECDILINRLGHAFANSNNGYQKGLEIFKSVVHFFYSEEWFTIRADSNGHDGESTEIELRDGIVVKYGLGGAHGSTEEPLYVESKNGYVILHADFSAMYPSIMISYDVYPPMFPASMRNVFKKFAQARDEYKAAGDTEASLAYKPILNSVPGRFKYKYSCMYHPATNFQICSIGQTLISFMALIVKGRLIQLDTDGIMVLCKESEYDENAELIRKMSEIIRLKIKVEKFDWFAQQNIHSYGFSQDSEIDGIGGFFGGKSEWDPNLIGVQSIIQKAIMTGKNISRLVREELEKNNIKNLIIVSKTTAKFNAFQIKDYGSDHVYIFKNRYILSVAVMPDIAKSLGADPKEILKIGGDKIQKISSFPPVVANVNTRDDMLPIECVDIEYYTNLIYSKMQGIADLLGIKK